MGWSDNSVLRGSGAGCGGGLFALLLFGAILAVIAGSCSDRTPEDTVSFTDTLGAGYQSVTISVDVDDAPPEIYFKSLRGAEINCDVSPPGRVVQVPRRIEVEDGQSWELIWKVSAPVSGEYRLTCNDNGGGFFGIRQP
ncbi:hypothetical protein ACIBI9_56035 [Nonomuraea sp. NPDC050451]|uniref:hypothetical protein n=1 Tax=Nonomuraea sp. NPDC050451 TaxID=3364364 RepID=UPI00378B89A5